ncbi:MAG: T9SS type A sorting domain-containing protein [Rhodothermaceae bacterium]
MYKVNVAATDVNLGVPGEALTFSFLDPTTAQGATITKLTDTTAVVKWKAGSITGGMKVVFDILVTDTEGLKDTSMVQITVLDYTDVTDTETPEEYSLSQNYPNPFNPTTKLKFGIPFESDVKVVIYNILGQQVKTLVNEVMDAGFHTVTFDASSLPSGVYIYRIKAVATDGSETFVSTRKSVLVK